MKCPLYLILQHKEESTQWFTKGLFGVGQYRVLNDYKSASFIFSRTFDKMVFSLLLLTLYWKRGDDLGASNVTNMAALLYTVTCTPAATACIYVSALVRHTRCQCRQCYR